MPEIQDWTALRCGDIVIGTYHNGHGHTAIVVERVNDDGNRDSYRLAHCPGPQLTTVVEDLGVVFPVGDVADDRMFAWNRVDQDKQNLAATLANYWSTTHQTAYGAHPGADVANASRARGVARQYDHGNGTLPPFEFDALYRVFKWAAKYQNQQTFSANRGTTCCSFVMACHQAAAARHAMENSDYLVTQAYDILTEERNAKPNHPNPVPNQALRQNSNVGSDRSYITGRLANRWGIHRLWESLFVRAGAAYEADGGWYNGPRLEETLTPALLLDAKFTYTMAFKGVLELANSGWTAR